MHPSAKGNFRMWIFSAILLGAVFAVCAVIYTHWGYLALAALMLVCAVGMSRLSRWMESNYGS